MKFEIDTSKEEIIICSCYIGVSDNGLMTEISIPKSNLGKWGKCTISVKGNEGTIPHMHIKPQNKDYECCVCLFDNKYFNHDHNHYEMGPAELKDLDKVLRKKCFTYEDEEGKEVSLSNWDMAVRTWVSYMDGKKYEHDNDYNKLEQPDYTKTEGNRYTGNKAPNKRK